VAISAETTTALITAGAVVVGAILGGFITVGVTWLQNRHATSEREATVAADRGKRAAAILGRARVFLTDIHPDRVAFNVNAEVTPKEFESLAARLNVLCDDISIFAAAEADERNRGAAARMEVALFNAFNSAKWLAGDVLAHRDLKDSLEAAKRNHLRAGVLVRIVLDRVHGRDVADLEAWLQTLDKLAVGDIEAALEDLDRPKPEPAG
jgi:hypothetical protein